MLRKLSPSLLRSSKNASILSSRWKWSRLYSSSKLDPVVQGFSRKLAETQPCFSLPSSSVRVMHEPKDYYQCLLDMIRRAEHRIFLSSLYIGAEERELLDNLTTALRSKPSLQLRLHLDLNRSTRPGPDSTARVLLPLIKEFPDRVHVSLFRSPKLKGLMAKVVPPRFNEGWGTWHPKIYGVDEEVMLSGANLNQSYFTNRQDRYLHFTSQRELSQYCFAFLDSSSQFSYRLLPSSSLTEYTLQWSDTQTHPYNIEAKGQRVLSHLQNSYRLTSTGGLPLISQKRENDKDDVLVFPILQAGQFGIREEERALALLFAELAEQSKSSSSEKGGPLMDLTSGYFGLYHKYRDFVLQSPIACRIIAASPKANGFYGSRGISGRIPEGYTLLEQRFMRAVRVAQRKRDSRQSVFDESAPGVELNEWEREGWTYHAKGIWLRSTPTSDPSLTLFGSTNLNSRSSNLDTELSFILATSSSSLQRQLGAEVDGLREHVGPWRGEERKVRTGTKALVALVGGML